MSLHEISYDLSKPGRDYEDLIAAIKALGTWSHPLESVWIVKSPKTTAEIRDALIKVIDSNDHLLVVAMTGDWASYGITKPVTDWLQRV